jgi:FkbM family methyltransferase
VRYNEVKLEIWNSDEFMIAPDEELLSCCEGPLPVAVDLGAHVGTRALMLATDGGFKKVFAVEMEMENYMLLCRNVERNGMVDVIIPVLAAISDKHELCPVYFGRCNRGQFSIAYNAPSFQKRPGLMATTPLSYLLDLIGPVDFLKMDLEGVEYKLFANPLERAAIREHVNFLFLERHGPNTDYFTDRYFLDLGYDPKDPQARLFEHLASCGFSDVKENAPGQIMAYNRFKIEAKAA